MLVADIDKDDDESKLSFGVAWPDDYKVASGSPGLDNEPMRSICDESLSQSLIGILDRSAQF